MASKKFFDKDTSHTTPEGSLDRREFMKLFGKLAIYTPPSLAMLIDSGGNLALQPAEANPGSGEEPMSLRLEGFKVK